jgi:hypothetical protein
MQVTNTWVGMDMIPLLRIGSIPFTLHKTKVNNLHKYVSTFMRNEVVMQEKNGEVCNQD